MRGAEALALAREYQPTAVSLDVFLPDMLGWTVLSQLKQDPATRHIPVQIVTLDEDRQHGLARGAFSFITKPTTTEGLEAALARIKDYAQPASQAAAGRRGQRGRADWASRSCWATTTSTSSTVGTGAERPGRAAATSLPTASCSTCGCPTCRASRCWSGSVTTRRSATCRWWSSPAASCPPDEDAQLHTMARSVVVKGVESPERLLDETALFLHRVVADLPAEKQRMLERLHARTRIWSAGRCCSWTTMCATSLRSAACWSGAA